MDTNCLKIPGYEFWIETDKGRAKQYQIEETNEPGSNVVSCYIASEVGQEFRIGIQMHKDGQVASVRSYMNDDSIDKLICSFPGVDYISHIYTAENETRKFAFSTINFEEDELAELTSIPPNLGTIRLEIFRVAKLHQTHRGPPQITMLSTPVLSEKSKAIGLHTTTLLKPEKINLESWSYYTNDYIDSRESPWYTVKFLYRPLDTLQAEGIAPTPAPLPGAALGEAHGRGERGLGNRRSSDSITDKKPVTKTIKSEFSKVDGPRASREQPIVIEIEDSDGEHSNHLPNKRSKKSLNPQGRRKKRKPLDPVVIVLDSD